jgi:hypothetical protein
MLAPEDDLSASTNRNDVKVLTLLFMLASRNICADAAASESAEVVLGCDRPISAEAAAKDIARWGNRELCGSWYDELELSVP